MTTAEPKEVGIDSKRLERFFRVVEEKIRDRWLTGGVFAIARRGRLVAVRSIGETAPGRAARAEDVFCLFSSTKPVTATMLLMKADRGDLRITDRVSDYIPEFAAAGKRDVTIAQALTHTGGFPTIPPDWPLTSWGDWDATIARISAWPVEFAPGSAVAYHALSASWILAEISRRVDGGKRSFAQMVAEDIYAPLGMRDSSMGCREDLRARRVPLRAIDQGGAPFPMELLEAFNAPEILAGAVPGANSHSTAFDMARFYQMWLNRGELDGVRLLSPAMVELATTIHTGDMPDRFLEPIHLAAGWPIIPANRGLGFWLRGTAIAPNYFGTLATPRTFGHAGASSILTWADPVRELVFVGLTAGLILEHRNILRFHLFSDLVEACVTD